MRTLRTVGLTLAAVAAALILWNVFGPRTGIPLFDWDRARQSTIQLLRSEKLLFLVTHRVVTLVLVESKERSLLFGNREGFLVGEVRLLYGLNLEELSQDAVRREGEIIVVSLPDPKPLSFDVDLGSLRFFSRRSGTMVVVDWLTGRDLRDELQKEFKNAAMKYLHEKNLLPDRAEIVTRLNGVAALFASRTGVPVVFR